MAVARVTGFGPNHGTISPSFASSTLASTVPHQSNDALSRATRVSFGAVGASLGHVGRSLPEMLAHSSAYHACENFCCGPGFPLHEGAIGLISRVPFALRFILIRGAAGYLSTGWGGVPWLTPIPSSNWGWT